MFYLIDMVINVFVYFIVVDVFVDDTPYNEEVTLAAVELYGLIHARYIVTIPGLEAMVIIHDLKLSLTYCMLYSV